MKKIIIVIPVYNCEKYITKCLESIKNQTFADYEIIIINDNSTDTTGIKVARFIEQNPDMDVSVIYNKVNLGSSVARNLGLRKASEEFILFVDGDDYYCNNRVFEHFNTKLTQDTDILIFGSNIEHLGNIEKMLKHMRREKMKNERGITLIALVVTIVVLVILGTISMIGILRRKWLDFENTKGKRDA